MNTKNPILVALFIIAFVSLSASVSIRIVGYVQTYVTSFLNVLYDEQFVTSLLNGTYHFSI